MLWLRLRDCTPVLSAFRGCTCPANGRNAQSISGRSAQLRSPIGDLYNEEEAN